MVLEVLGAAIKKKKIQIGKKEKNSVSDDMILSIVNPEDFTKNYYN